MWKDIEVGDFIENDEGFLFEVQKKQGNILVGKCESPFGMDEAIWYKSDYEKGLKSGRCRLHKTLKISIVPETGLLHLSLPSGDIELAREDVNKLYDFCKAMNIDSLTSKRDF